MSYVKKLYHIILLIGCLSFKVSNAFSQKEQAIEVYFETDSFRLEKQNLLKVKQWLDSFPQKKESYRWEITGHTDNIGSKKYNELLSSRRCKSVLGFLMGSGIDFNSIVYTWHDFSNPNASNEAEKGRAQNRRCEIKAELWESFIYKKRGLGVPWSVYNGNMDMGFTIEHDSCTKITIPPNTFIDSLGNVVIGNVQIHYKEYRDMVDCMFSGLPMSYEENGKTKLYKSGGMFELQAFQNGDALTINPGITLDVKFCLSDSSESYNLYRFRKGYKKWNIQEQAASRTMVNTSSIDGTLSNVEESVNTNVTNEFVDKELINKIEVVKEKEDNLEIENNLIEEEDELSYFNLLRWCSSYCSENCQTLLKATKTGIELSKYKYAVAPFPLSIREDNYHSFKYAGLIRSDSVCRAELTEEVFHIKMKRKFGHKNLGFKISFNENINEELSVYKSTRWKFKQKWKSSITKGSLKQDFCDMRVIYDRDKNQFHLEFKSVNQFYKIPVKMKNLAFWKSDEKILENQRELSYRYSRIMEEKYNYSATSAPIGLSDSHSDYSDRCFWYFARKWMPLNELEMPFSTWIYYFNSEKKMMFERFTLAKNKLSPCGEGLVPLGYDSITGDPPFPVGPKVLVNEFELGIYNYDVVVELDRPVKIHGKFIDDSGQELKIASLFLLDKSLKGLLAIKRESFQISPFSQNNLVLIDIRGRIYVFLEKDFENIKLKDKAEVVFQMEDVNNRVKGLTDLKKILGI